MTTIYPAIDLKNGQCVRLFKGDMNAATVFNDSPANQAKAFADAGISYLHVVDLNGAFDGAPTNKAAVEAILDAVDVPLQVGGGIRTIATIDSWLSAGVARVILGTVAVNNPDLVREACKLFPGRIAVGIDARSGMVAVEGWAETSSLSDIELTKRFADAGVAAIIHTDIDRDGTLTGVNVAGTAKLAATTDIPVIASGGVKSIDDIHAVKAATALEGVVVGRALYDGGLDLSDALRVAGA